MVIEDDEVLYPYVRKPGFLVALSSEGYEKYKDQLADDGVLVAAICHASWVLVSADLVDNRRIACPPDMAVDVRNAGGIYVEERAVMDGNLITAVYFAYLPEQFRILMPALQKLVAARRKGKSP